MKKSLIGLFLTALLFSSNVFAQPDSKTDTTPAPYNKEELPQWVKDFRDTEIITLGAFPFVTLGVTLTYSLYILAKNNFDSTYFVNPFVKSGSYTEEEQIGIIVTSSFICLGVGLTNLTINLIKRGVDKNRNKQFLQDNIKITTIDNEVYIIPIPSKYLRNKNYLYGTIENAVF